MRWGPGGVVQLCLVSRNHSGKMIHMVASCVVLLLTWSLGTSLEQLSYQPGVLLG